MTEVEPEFDAEERDSWDAWHEWKQSVCPDCGNLLSICSSPDGMHGEGHYPQRRICWVTATAQVAGRQFRELHEKARPDESGFLPTDGVAVWASPENLSPDDDFLSDVTVDLAQRAAERDKPVDND